MKKVRLIISYLCVFSLFYSAAQEQNKPYGLMTDFLQHTDKVFISGYQSTTPLSERDNAIEPTQISPVLSTHPSLSWIVPDGGKETKQTAYRIIVSDSLAHAVQGIGPVWDSGIVQSDRSVSVEYGGNALQPDALYYWRVKTYTNTAGESDWSDIQSFQTGEYTEKYQSAGELLVKSAENPEGYTNPQAGVHFFDFGKASFGQLLIRLTTDVEKDTITIRLGEKETDGRVDANPGGTIRFQSHTLPLRKGTHFYRIKMHKDRRNTLDVAVKMPDYIGEVMPFRYAEVLGYDREIERNDLVRESVWYPFDESASYFHCDNDTLNRIWDLCKYTMKATSFTGIYVDGDRERIPYEADILINQLSHYAVDREYSIARRSLEYILEKPTWPTEWILQAILIAWNDYLYTGDARSLEKNYEVLKNRSLMQLETEKGLISTTTGLQTKEFLNSIRFHEPVKDIVDWPTGERDDFVFCDHNAVVNAFYYEGLKTMEKIAVELGKKEEAAFYANTHKKVYSVFNDTFFDSRRKIYVDGDTTCHASLHSNMFAAVFGLVPEKHRQSVQDFIASRGMACSVYGAQFLMDALYSGGNGKYAEELLLSTGERSWYNMIRAGSTVALEAWDIKYKPNLDWNHAWGATPGNSITRHLLGINPVSPGFGEITIRPHIYSLSSVESITPTIRGAVFITYKKQDENEYTLTVTIPANMEADVYLPVDNEKTIRQLLLDGTPFTVKKNARQGEHVYVGKLRSGEYTYSVSMGNG